MYLLTEVVFYSGQRKTLPQCGYYRLDAIFQGNQEYWGITFLDFQVEAFDVFCPAIIKFSFQESHYGEVTPNQTFAIMEGARKVGEGKIISIQK